MLMREQRLFPGIDVNTHGDTRPTLAAAASTSAPLLRHRSSTLKPPEKQPTRLNLFPSPLATPSNGSPSPHSPPPVSRTKSTAYPSPLPTASYTTATARPVSPGPAKSPPLPPNHATGIRAHFAQLLPRHAVFLVRITIHQLNNVPLVRGEFGVSWKVKGVTNGGILGKVKGRGKGKGKLGNAKGYATPTTSTTFQDAQDSVQRTKESDKDSGSLLDQSASVSDTHSIAASSSAHSYDHGLPGSLPRSRSVGQSHPHATPRNIPALVVSSNGSHAPSPPVSRSVSGTSIISTPSSAQSKLHLPAHYLSAEWHPQSQTYSPPFTTAMHEEPVPSLADTPPTDGYAPAKGQTPFVQLKEHKVVWEQTLDFVVQMNVGKETGELNDSPAKLVVMQRVIPGDADAPRNPRVGTIHLNLAQYVGAGVVTRRYLLRQSKTNATIKLTIQLEHTGGATSYTAPPLPKGEILSGVTGILESDTYLNRPRTLGLYSSSSSGSSDSLSSGDSSPSALNSEKDQSKAQGGARRRKNKPKRKHFDPSKLPDVRGPRATEKLIEAIFNPVPVTSPTQVNAFTYLIGIYDEQDGAYEGGDQASPHSRCNKEISETSVDGVESPFFYGDVPLEGKDGEQALEGGAECQDSESDYHSFRSRRSGSLRASEGEQSGNKRSLRSLGSRLGLQLDLRSEHDVVGENTVRNNDHTVAGEEKRPWWQKVLRPA